MKTDEKTARLTREGAVFGTPAYMSPEQVKGQGSVDHRADLWALGCMAYECLTGRPVWNTEQGVAMTFAAIATSPLPVPSRFRPDLPPAFDAWFKTALERDAERALPDREGARRRAGEGARHAADLAGERGRRRRARSSSRPSPACRRSQRDGDGTPSSQRGSGIKAAKTDVDDGERAARPPHPQLAKPERDRLAAHGGPRGSAACVASASSARASGAFLLWLVVLARRRRRRLVRVREGRFARGWRRAKPRRSRRRPRPPPRRRVGLGAQAPPPPPEQPKWMTPIEEGQQLLASGDADGALRKFKDASDAGGGAVAKSFLDQVKLGAATTGPCKMVALLAPAPRLRRQRRAARRSP